jgi:hypothetical protein
MYFHELKVGVVVLHFSDLTQHETLKESFKAQFRSPGKFVVLFGDDVMNSSMNSGFHKSF